MSDEQKKQSGGFLGLIERVGNALPDPAVLFVIALGLVWAASVFWGDYEFLVPTEGGEETRQVANQLTGNALTEFFVDMVRTFTGFHPLGVVLVALLGVGVAEASGFINVGLKLLLSVTPKLLLTPFLLLAAIVSHTAADAGYVLVIPLGGAIFYAAGRHPLAGIACAFAGVSGGFSANFIPSGVDPLLQGITQEGGQLMNPALEVNPLCNLYFTAASSVLVILVGWFITDRIIEPRLSGVVVDGDPDDMPVTARLSGREVTAFFFAFAALAAAIGMLFFFALPESSPLRAPLDPLKPEAGRSLTAFSAPLMKMIVPIIFVLFLIPGLVHGYVAGTFKSHRDVIQAMGKSMSTMGYYLVLAFFASLFIYAFGKSNLGALLAVKGAEFLTSLGAGATVTIVGIILLCASVNLVVGSASAKWALLAPIFVPMLMQLGISPELTQAAYRVGDSSTNIVTPLMPYFPLVVTFSQRYVKKVGIGTLISMMLAYSLSFLVLWTGFLLLYWMVGYPLGLQAQYVYPPVAG